MERWKENAVDVNDYLTDLENGAYQNFMYGLYERDREAFHFCEHLHNLARKCVGDARAVWGFRAEQERERIWRTAHPRRAYLIDRLRGINENGNYRKLDFRHRRNRQTGKTTILQG